VNQKKSSHHCNLCAWRATCKLKFSLSKTRSASFYCQEFTRDVTLADQSEEQPSPVKPKSDNTKTDTSKRYFSHKTKPTREKGTSKE
jgi:hypothetical protein